MKQLWNTLALLIGIVLLAILESQWGIVGIVIALVPSWIGAIIFTIVIIGCYLHWRKQD